MYSRPKIFLYVMVKYSTYIEVVHAWTLGDREKSKDRKITFHSQHVSTSLSSQLFGQTTRGSKFNIKNLNG
ncbi:hypothetical protein Pmani_023018 [Petrolisthes manimaculis]|uniref:Uncharacterized protein n=1 Tax=Petrolisthes manimaculis TaxID=1843537 RepID=A0AAE1U3V2_9EUCA|nr:hypothetical protein Pmani_023018 [Petrolisthes manimaculis]